MVNIIVEGAELPKVFHYFKEAHPYFNQNVVIIGGKILLRCCTRIRKSRRKCTVIYRERYPKALNLDITKFRVISYHEKITMEFNANVTQITEDTVTMKRMAVQLKSITITYLQ